MFPFWICSSQNNLYLSNVQNFSKMGTCVLSILLIFITSFTAFFYWIIRLDQMVLVTLLFFLYFFLILFLIISLIKRNTLICSKKYSGIINSHSLYKILIIIFISAFYIWIFYSTHLLPNTLNILHDEVRHVGLVQQLLSGWYSWQSLETGFMPSYPYFFHLIIASVSSLSAIPVLNVFLSFFFILMLPSFAFYFMVNSIIKNKIVPAMATIIFSTFSGFGWIYTLYYAAGANMSNIPLIIESSMKTYDIIYSTWCPIYIAPVAIDLSVFYFNRVNWSQAT